MDMQQPMEMVRHKTIGEDVCVRFEMLLHLPEKKKIISLIEEDLLPVVALVEDMINQPLLKIHKEKSLRGQSCLGGELRSQNRGFIPKFQKITQLLIG